MNYFALAVLIGALGLWLLAAASTARTVFAPTLLVEAGIIEAASRGVIAGTLVAISAAVATMVGASVIWRYLEHKQSADTGTR